MTPAMTMGSITTHNQLNNHTFFSFGGDRTLSLLDFGTRKTLFFGERTPSVLARFRLGDFGAVLPGANLRSSFPTGACPSAMTAAMASLPAVVAAGDNLPFVLPSLADDERRRAGAGVDGLAASFDGLAAGDDALAAGVDGLVAGDEEGSVAAVPWGGADDARLPFATAPLGEFVARLRAGVDPAPVLAARFAAGGMVAKRARVKLLFCSAS